MKMNRSVLLILLAGIFFIPYSCKKDMLQEPQYKRPDWLAGKLYSQINAEDNLKIFTQCLKLVGYDVLLDKSGVYTIFAPDDNAFHQYFLDHPEYNNKIEEIPLSELTRIVNSHIILDPWSVQQLQQLDVYGWIDTTDENNNKPKGFKRETLQLDKGLKYGVVKEKYEDVNNLLNYTYYKIVDTLQSTWHRRNAVDAGKYASVFYKKYMEAYGLNSDDYQFYFNRTFESPSDIYYMNGKIIKGDIFAENGFIHIIDKVIEPLQNAYEILNNKKNTYSYSKFLNLINSFPSFSYNTVKTYSQPGANAGQVVDSLFDISYPGLSFNILNEKTTVPNDVSLPGVNDAAVRYQNGLIAPDNDALGAFESKYLVGQNKWGGLNKIPPFIRAIIVNSHMCNSPIYPTSFKNGFLNEEQDLVKLDEPSIIQKQFGSNASFIGVNNAIVPRAFKSVAAPIFLDTRFLFSLIAIDGTGLLSALKKPDIDYSFFIESDDSCRSDSSLVFRNRQFMTYQRIAGATKKPDPIFLTIEDVRTLFMNHIGTETPKGTAKREFIRTLGGNYIVVDNVTKIVSGTAPTTVGYNGSKTVDIVPSQINMETDNGKTYEISHWFNFTATSIYSKIASSASLSSFDSLLFKAGLVDRAHSTYTFLNNSNYYTIFAPTNSALKNYRTDTLTTTQLKKFLLMHFIQRDMIFTDGKKPSKYYQTLREDEKSTSTSTVFTNLYIKPGTDVINISDKNGGNYLSVNEAGTSTNVIAGYLVKTQTPATFPAYVANGVIHQISKVLLFKDVDTN
jgi:uncharacterized surface protein with fasciclin (FAS1) repeats